ISIPDQVLICSWPEFRSNPGHGGKAVGITYHLLWLGLRIAASQKGWQSQSRNCEQKVCRKNLV
ncbi:MAG: hypothetical protein RLN96_11975, partial [Pseudomonadales bacterium]